MNLQIILFTIFIGGITSFAQTVHLPSYFVLNDGGRWIYQDEFGNQDTSTMRLNVPFAGESAVEISFGPTEKQFFKASTSGLQMLGQTIALGTFRFDPPLGISSLDASAGDSSWIFNWRVTHVPSGLGQEWGSAYVLLSNLYTDMTLQDSRYDSVLVIHTAFSTGDAEYYLAKGVGIVMMRSRGSPFFMSRVLLKYLPGNTSVTQSSWQS